MTSLYGYSCLSSSTVSADDDLLNDDPFDRFINSYVICVIESVESCNTLSLSNIYISLSMQREWFPTRTRMLFGRLAEYFHSARFYERWENVFDQSFREFLHRWFMEASCLVY